MGKIRKSFVPFNRRHFDCLSLFSNLFLPSFLASSCPSPFPIGPCISSFYRDSWAHCRPNVFIFECIEALAMPFFCVVLQTQAYNTKFDAIDEISDIRPLGLMNVNILTCVWLICGLDTLFHFFSPFSFTLLSVPPQCFSPNDKIQNGMNKFVVAIVGFILIELSDQTLRSKCILWASIIWRMWVNITLCNSALVLYWVSLMCDW